MKVLFQTISKYLSTAACIWQLALLFIAGTTTLSARPGPDTLRLNRALTAQATYATTDQLDNIYLVTPTNAIEKYDSTGKRSAVYTNKRLGVATFLDVTNPLKVLVWYPDFQTLVFLDRTLTEMGRLNFTMLGYNSIRTVAVAADGNLWVFDDAISKTFKMTPDGTPMFESQPLNVAFASGFSATRIRDNGQLVYLSDPQNGLCTLDPYANLVGVSPFVKFSDFDLSGDWLVFTERQTLNLKNTLVHQTLTMRLPESLSGAQGLWVSRYGLLVQRGEQLELYRWY